MFTVNVEIPRGLNEKQKEHVRAFAESCGDNNYTKKTGFFKRIFDRKCSIRIMFAQTAEKCVSGHV